MTTAQLAPIRIDSLKKENREIDRIADILRVFAPAFVTTFANGHSGWGWYVHSEDYPDEGSALLVGGAFLTHHGRLVAVAETLVGYELSAVADEF